MTSKIGIVGGGSWGTAIGATLAKNGHLPTLWAREKEVVEGINQSRRNPIYFPEAPLPKNWKATSDLKSLVAQSDILINVVPSHATREVWKPIADKIDSKTVIVNASKGFEYNTQKRLSEVFGEILPQISPSQILTLSGPSFAKEVLEEKPTLLVVAGKEESIAQKIQKLFRNDWMMVYVSNDPIGVEIGGAVKNVIAIGCGICDGMGLGTNTRAAMITRGLYEMAKLGQAMGANPFTFVGLTGMGDLILTCTGELSRNRAVGLALGRGEKLDDILKGMKYVAEGVKTAKSVYTLIQKYSLTAPLCIEIYKIIHEKKSPKAALKDLSQLELKAELGGLLS